MLLAGLLLAPPLSGQSLPPDERRQIVDLQRDVQRALTRADSVLAALLPADRVAPSVVTLVAPPAGATVRGFVTLDVNATDDRGVARVSFRIDNIEIGVDSVAPFQVQWYSRMVANGSHTYTAVASDAAGNSRLSVVRTLTVNNPALVALVTYDSLVVYPRPMPISQIGDSAQLYAGLWVGGWPYLCAQVAGVWGFQPILVANELKGDTTYILGHNPMRDFRPDERCAPGGR